MENYKLGLFFSILLLILLAIFITNYTFGTYLLGWDNLMPELNIWINLKRSLQAVWQEYQGLGLLGGMAHASDLPRQIFLFISSLILPTSLLRYFYHFLMILLGALGTYFLLKNLILNEFQEKQRKLGAFFGSLFYVLNFGTIQIFYVPFEPYSTFFGFLPWEIYFLFKYLKEQTPQNLFLLCLINTLSLPQAYLQTVFLVYLLVILIIFSIYIFQHKTVKSLIISFKILIIIFLINSFWILPNAYFVLTNAAVTQDAMQNKLATQITLEQNRNKGNLLDFATLNEMYYDLATFSVDPNQTQFLMQSWRDHFSILPIKILGFILFAVVLIGWVSKTHFRVYLLSLLVLVSIALLSDTLIFAQINELIRKIPLLNQIFRNPFTKFIIPAIFVFSLGFGIGVVKLLTKVDKLNSNLPKLLIPVFVLIFASYMFPTFRGEFISPKMRVKLPDEYIQLIDYLKLQDPNGRIMNLPQGSFWGWNFYKYGSFGSGFLWYGVEQPITDRSFDVWSSELEEYYFELSYALKKRDQKLFNNILEKYQIKYILVDENIILDNGLVSDKTIYSQKDILKDNPKAYIVASFDRISVYQTQLDNEPRENVYMFNNLPQAQKNEKFANIDRVFSSIGAYKTEEKAKFVYPFESLFTSRFSKEGGFNLTEDDTRFILKSHLPKGDITLVLPSLTQVEYGLPTQVLAKKEGREIVLRLRTQPPRVFVDNQEISFQNKTKFKEFRLDDQGRPLILNLNGRDFYNLTNLEPEFKLLGSTYLINSRFDPMFVNYFKIYDSQPSQTTALDPTQFIKADQFGGATSGSFFSNIEGNSLVLGGRNTALCSKYQDILSLKANSLIGVNFSYKSFSDEYPKYCIYSFTKADCINKKDGDEFGFTTNNQGYVEFVENENPNQDQVEFSFILEALRSEEKDQDKKVSYSNASFSTYPLLSKENLNIFEFEDPEIEMQISLTENSEIKVEFPKVESSYSLIDPIGKKAYKRSPLNYDIKPEGEYSLDDSNEIVSLTAKNATSYLLFRKGNTGGGLGYIAKLNTKNLAGSPAIINISTELDARNYLYSQINKSKEFETQYYILPPVYQFDKGVNLLFGSVSYNSHSAINQLTDLNIYPFPYEFLTNIYVKDSQGEAKLIPYESEKKAIHQYVVYPQTNKTSVLVLSQSYHPGWVLYALNTDNSFIDNFKLSLPFIFGTRVGEHILVNNWQNGWEMKSSLDKNTLVIYYLPQLLEYIGLIMLAIVHFALFLRLIKGQNQA